MNYCQELPNVELIVWQLERAEKHQNFLFLNTRRLIVVLIAFRKRKLDFHYFSGQN